MFLFSCCKRQNRLHQHFLVSLSNPREVSQGQNNGKFSARSYRTTHSDLHFQLAEQLDNFRIKLQLRKFLQVPLPTNQKENSRFHLCCLYNLQQLGKKYLNSFLFSVYKFHAAAYFQLLCLDNSLSCTLSTLLEQIPRISDNRLLQLDRNRNCMWLLLSCLQSICR